MSTDGAPDPLPASFSPAERVFFDFIEKRLRGEDVSFDALCRTNPALETDLRRQFAPSMNVLLSLTGATKPATNVTHKSDGPASDRLKKLSTRAGTGAEPRYKLEGELARGGMGAILKVWDEDLRRHLRPSRHAAISLECYFSASVSVQVAFDQHL